MAAPAAPAARAACDSEVMSLRLVRVIHTECTGLSPGRGGRRAGGPGAGRWPAQSPALALSESVTVGGRPPAAARDGRLGSDSGLVVVKSNTN